MRSFASDLRQERNGRETWLTPAEEEERLRELRQAPVSAARRPGGVYFIQHGPGGKVKIGHTRGEPLERMATLQVGTPVPLRLLAWWPEVDRSDEEELHETFAEYRLTGEWFESCHAIWDYMALFRAASS